MIAVLPLALAAAIGGPHQPVLTPIGVGRRFRLPAATPAVQAGRPLGAIRCADPSAPAGSAHVELFAAGRVLLLPPGIGVAQPSARDGARVRPGGCVYPLRTLDPTGVVWLGRARGLTLDSLFAVWGQPLGRHRLAGFRSREPVRVYVNGVRRPGPVGSVPLTRGLELVLEIGPYVPPHRSFGFSGRAVT